MADILFSDRISGLDFESTQYAIPSKLSSELWVFGDSITVPYVVTTPESYWGLLQTHVGGIPVNNQANFGAGSAGRGVVNTAYLIGLNFPNSGANAASLFAGFNDIRRGGTDQKTINKILGATQAWIATYWLREDFVLAGSADSSITKNGTWTTGIDTSAYPGTKNSNAAQSTVLDSDIKYTSPNPEASIMVGFIGGDNSGGIYNYADVEVYLDDVLQTGPYTGANMSDGQADATFDNKRTPLVVYFTGLDNSVTHSIRIKQKTNGAYLTVTHFGHFRTDQPVKPLVYQIPYMLTYDGVDSQIKTDTMNGYIANLITSFPTQYRPLLAHTNTYYTPSTGDSGDGHPNAVGHAQIYQSALAVIGTNFQYAQPGQFFARITGFYGGIDGDEVKIVTSKDFTPSTGLSRDVNGNVTVDLSTGKGGSLLGVTQMYGGNAAGETLQINSTSHATKGFVRFANGTLSIDDTTGTVGFGTGGLGGGGAAFYARAQHDNISNFISKASPTYTADHFLAYDSNDVPLTRISAGGGMRISGPLTTATGPAGMELFIDSGSFYLQAYNRNSSAWVPVIHRGLSELFAPEGIQIAIITKNGVQLIPISKATRNALTGVQSGTVIMQSDNTPGLRTWNGSNWIKYAESTDD